MGAENQQAQIFVRESDEIQRKLSLKAGEGSYKSHDYMASGKDECRVWKQIAQIVGRTTSLHNLFIG